MAEKTAELPLLDKAKSINLTEAELKNKKETAALQQRNEQEYAQILATSKKVDKFKTTTKSNESDHSSVKNPTMVSFRDEGQEKIVSDVVILTSRSGNNSFAQKSPKTDKKNTRNSREWKYKDTHKDVQDFKYQTASKRKEGITTMTSLTVQQNKGRSNMMPSLYNRLKNQNKEQQNSNHTGT